MQEFYEKTMKERLENILCFVENTDNYYAGFRHVIENIAVGRELNQMLYFDYEEISNDEFLSNSERLQSARQKALETHLAWQLNFFENTKTKHTTESIVRTVWSDIFDFIGERK